MNVAPDRNPVRKAADSNGASDADQNGLEERNLFALAGRLSARVSRVLRRFERTRNAQSSSADAPAPRGLLGSLGQFAQLVKTSKFNTPADWMPRLFGESSATLGQDLTGGRHALAYLRHLARGNRIQRRAFFENISDDRPPVLLIHGFLGTRGSMYILERRLIEDGVCVFSFNLGTFNTQDIRTSAFLIHRKIESILSQTSVKKIDIIGHSMGGLIGLYYIKKLGGADKVRKHIMIGSPVQGTWAALAGVLTMGIWSSSSWQLLPNSGFLKELHAGPLPPSVEYYTVAAARDWVCPPRSTVLDGAQAVTVPLGHSSLVMSEQVYEKLAWALAS